MRNIRISISPPLGEIKISAPLRVSLKEITKFAETKIDWAIYQQKIIRDKYKDSLKNFTDGETHQIFDNKFSLKIIKNCKKSQALISQNIIEIHIKEGIEETLELKQKLFEKLCKLEMEKIIPKFITDFEKIMNVKVEEFRIRKMKTRWGTCNIRKQKIWINLELTKKPLECLKYIVAHEMTHLLEKSHNKRFYRLMEQFMPEWRKSELELKKSIIF